MGTLRRGGAIVGDLFAFMSRLVAPWPPGHKDR
jgi:hypothetical protein